MKNRSNDAPTSPQVQVFKWLGWLSWIPLTVSLLVFPSLERTAHLVDGPDTTCRGAPLIWNCDSIAFSLHKELYLQPLLLDVAILAGAAILLVLALGLLLRNKLRPIYFGLVLFLWLWGAASGFLLGVGLAFETTYRDSLPHDVSSFGPSRLGFGL